MALLQERRLETDIRGLHPLDPDDLHELGAEPPYHQVVGSFVLVGLPHVGVDVREEEIDLLLRQEVQADALGDDVSDELVVPLAARLVGGLVGVREERLAAALTAAIVLDLVEPPELDAVVAEVHLEDLPEALAEKLLEASDLLQDRGGALLRYEEAELEAELRVGDGQDGLLVGHLALDGVVLPDVGAGVGGDVLQVVAEGAAEHPLDVDDLPLLGVFVLVLIAHVARQLVRLDAQVAAVEVPSDRPLAAYRLEGFAARVDVMEGLPVLDPGGDDGVDPFQILAAYPLEGPRLPSAPLRRLVGVDAVVVSLEPAAELRLRAPVAGVGEFPPPRAFAGGELRAPAAVEFRGPLGLVAALPAVRARVAAVPVCAVADDLAVDRGSRFAQVLRDPGERVAFGHARLEVDAIVVVQSFLFHAFISFLGGG